MNNLQILNHQIKINSIFVEISGYEQTNVKFYQVVSLHGKKTVGVRKIGKDSHYDPKLMEGKAKAKLNDFKGDVEKRRVYTYNDNVYINVNCSGFAKLSELEREYRFSTYG